MTKKDYELIAEAIRSQYMVEIGDTQQGIYNVTILIAHKLQEQNPKFDRKRFLEACGVTE